VKQLRILNVPPRFRAAGRFFVRENGFAVYFGSPEAFVLWDKACDEIEARGNPDEDGPDLPQHVVILSHEVGPELHDDEVAWIAQALNMAASKPPAGRS